MGGSAPNGYILLAGMPPVEDSLRTMPLVIGDFL